MVFIAELIRESRNGLALVSPPQGALEERLFSIVGRVQQVLDGPQVPSVSSAGMTTVAQLNQDYYPLVARGAFDIAITQLQGGLGGALAGASIPRGSVGLGPIGPSIWDPRNDHWNSTVPGASFPLVVDQERLLGDALAPERASLTYHLNVRPLGGTDPLEHVCAYEFLAPAGLVPEGLVIFFSQTRSVVQGIGAGREVVRAQPLVRESSVWSVRWSPDPEAAPRTSLQIRYVGDPPHVRAHTWIALGQPDFAAPAPRSPGSPLPEPPRTALPGQVQDLAAFAVSFDEELALRAALVASATLHARDKRFFLELDRSTHPAGPAGAQFQMLGLFLAGRYQDRAARHHLGRSTTPDADEDRSWLPEARAAGDHLRGLLSTHYDTQGVIDLPAVGDAFERFGGGELTIFDTHGAPNGTNVFCFVELAALLVRLKVDEHLWSALLRLFGTACHVFTGSYHACGAPRAHCAYRVSNNPAGARRPSDQVKADLRRLWTSSADPVALYDRVVHAALRDDLPPRGVAPIELADFGCGRGAG